MSASNHDAAIDTTIEITTAITVAPDVCRCYATLVPS